MAQCANCQMAEASFLCTLSGDSRCAYCRTLARSPEEYRAINPKPKASGWPVFTWDGVLDTAAFNCRSVVFPSGP